jgi:hypothetical protein
MDGVDPYVVAVSTTQWPWPEPFFYPGPAVLLSVPLGWLPMPVAAGLFIGVPTCGLCWALSAGGWWRLWLFASPSFLMAVEVGQWSPAICLAALVPSLGWLAAGKPNLGAAALLWRCSPLAIGLAIALTVFSVVVIPHWPAEWMANLGRLEKHPAPLFTPSGCWLVVALLRWRRADARFLLCMAAVPQLLFFADQLPLYLLARSRRQAMMQLVAALAAYLLWFTLLRNGDLYVRAAVPYVLVGIYGPALLLVLSQRNEGVVPRWVERVASYLPDFARGKSPTLDRR